MAYYYFRAFLNGKEVPLAGFSINAVNSSLTVDVTLPSNESYADVAAGTPLVITDGEGKTFTQAVYAGFSASKTNYQYSQTLQFIHPVSILLNAPFAFPITGVSRDVYETTPDYILYKLTGGKDLGEVTEKGVPASFFTAVVSGNVKNLYDLLKVIAAWSTSFSGLVQNYVENNLNLKRALQDINVNVATSSNILAALCENNRFDTPTFIDVHWILNTLLMYTNQAIFCQPDGTITVGLADGVSLPATVKIKQADIEQVNITYSWIQPNGAVAFLSQSPETTLDTPLVSVVYDGISGKCVSAYNFDEISGLAANSIFGNYSPVSIAISVPYLSQEELVKKGMPSSSTDQYKTACSFAKRHYWRLYKGTNTYELIVPFGRVDGHVVGATCAFGLNNKIFFGQVVGISHVWNANGESYTKVTVQGVKGYYYSKDDKLTSNYYDLINPENKVTTTNKFESNNLPSRELTCF